MQQQLDTIADGFEYSLIQRRTDLSSWALSLTSLDTLRRAKGYVPKIYTVPISFARASVTPVSFTIQQQLHIFPGSYIWCISNSYSYSQNPSVPPTVKYYLYIRDEGAGIELFTGSFNTYLNYRGDAFSGPGGGSQPNLSQMYTDRRPNPWQVNPLLTQPYLISGSGLITIQISQVSPNPSEEFPINFNFIFACAVPLNPLTEIQSPNVNA